MFNGDNDTVIPIDKDNFDTPLDIKAMQDRILSLIHILNANNAHLRIWSSVMSQIHYDKGLKNKEFKKPDGLTTRSICSASGMTPSSPVSYTHLGIPSFI